MVDNPINDVPAFMISWAFKATWSIREGAYLVNEEDPERSEIKIDNKATDPVSKYYFWLMKEDSKDRFWKVDRESGEPRLSPGTLMRSLDERGFRISKRMESLYNQAYSGCLGTQFLGRLSKPIYIEAARLIWKKDRSLSKKAVAEELVNLPKFYKKEGRPLLIPYQSSTLMRLLNHVGPGKSGRPKKSDTEIHIDLSEIVAQLD